MKRLLTITLMAGLMALGLAAPASAAQRVTVNPECAEQSTRTKPNGSCIRGSECPVIGQKLTIDGNCVTHRKGRK